MGVGADDVLRVSRSGSGLCELRWDAGTGPPTIGADGFSERGFVVFADVLAEAGVSDEEAEGADDGETLYGPREEDFYVFFTLTSAYRYWFVQFDSGATETMLALSKLYFGTALDLEHDPEYPWERARERVGPYARAAEYRETFRFKGVSWDKTTTFIDEVQLVADARPVFLMTTSYHSSLAGNRILFAAPENPETPMVLTDQNDILADFVEVL